jgi:type VI secretion system secreted protein Hcp
MLNFRLGLAIVLSAILMGAGSGAWAASSIFLRLANIPGESTHERHKDEIELLSFNLGFVNDIAQGRGSGAATCDGVALTKNIDRASPGLLAAVIRGIHISQGVLSFTVEDGTQDYYVLTMRDILVTSLRQTDSEGGLRVLEKITIKAAAYLFVYRAMQPNGSFVEHRFGWDCVRNSQLSPS